MSSFPSRLPGVGKLSSLWQETYKKPIESSATSAKIFDHSSKDGPCCTLYGMGFCKHAISKQDHDALSEYLKLLAKVTVFNPRYLNNQVPLYQFLPADGGKSIGYLALLIASSRSPIVPVFLDCTVSDAKHVGLQLGVKVLLQLEHGSRHIHGPAAVARRLLELHQGQKLKVMRASYSWTGSCSLQVNAVQDVTSEVWAPAPKAKAAATDEVFKLVNSLTSETPIAAKRTSGSTDKVKGKRKLVCKDGEDEESDQEDADSGAGQPGQSNE